MDRSCGPLGFCPPAPERAWTGVMPRRPADRQAPSSPIRFFFQKLALERLRLNLAGARSISARAGAGDDATRPALRDDLPILRGDP